jgi:uncharacterized protein YjbI with pentapeptide repeats
MANPIDVKRMLDGDKNLQGADLSRVDFNREIENIAGNSYLARDFLRGVRFEGANLEGCQLGFIDLIDTDFSSANLNAAEISGADVSGALFNNALMANTRLKSLNNYSLILNRDLTLTDPAPRAGFPSFANANLSGSLIEMSYLSNVDFTSANLRGSNLFRSRVPGARFDGADLTDVEFEGGYARGASFRDAILKNTNFRWLRTMGMHHGLTLANSIRSAVREDLLPTTLTTFEGASLLDADFSFSQMEETSFDSATISNVSFIGSTLSHVSFVSAHLEHVRFNDSDISSTDFRARFCQGVSFKDARLFRCIHNTSDLVQCEWSGATLNYWEVNHYDGRIEHFPGVSHEYHEDFNEDFY